MMNRRNFLASVLALPAGLIAAAKAMPTEGLNLDEIFKQLYRIRKNHEPIQWFQTTRVTHCSTLEYDDAIDVAFGLPEDECRLKWHERRKERCRSRIAKLNQQRVLPLP